MFQAGQFRAAHEQYSHLLALPVLKHNKLVLAVVRCNRAAAAKEIGRYREALLDCSVAIDLNDRYVRAYIRRARVYAHLGDFYASLRWR